MGLSLAIFIKEIVLGTTPNRSDTGRNGKELSFLVWIWFYNTRKEGENWGKLFISSIMGPSVSGARRKLIKFLHHHGLVPVVATGPILTSLCYWAISSASVWSNRINNTGWMWETFLAAKFHCRPYLRLTRRCRDKKNFTFFAWKWGAVQLRNDSFSHLRSSQLLFTISLPVCFFKQIDGDSQQKFQ